MEYGESFIDEFGTSVVVRIQSGWEHVQLLMRFKNEDEPFSYGFTVKDFTQLFAIVNRVQAELAKEFELGLEN